MWPQWKLQNLIKDAWIRIWSGEQVFYTTWFDIMYYRIDCDPDIFAVILNWLRYGQVFLWTWLLASRTCWELHTVLTSYGKVYRFFSRQIWPRMQCVWWLNTLGWPLLWKYLTHHPPLLVFNHVHIFLISFPLMSEAGKQILSNTLYLKSFEQENQRQPVIFDPLPEFIPCWNVFGQFQIHTCQV